MNKFLTNIKKGYDVTDTENLDSADIVQTILIIAAFAVVVIIATGWIGTAVLNKGADVATCIEGSTTFKKGDKGYENCAKTDHASVGNNSFKKDSTYKDRFGNDTSGNK